MQAARRLRAVQSQVSCPIRFFSTTRATSASMTGKLEIDSKVRMNSGYEIPRLGFGVYQTPATDAADALTHALNAGYRHIDSAAAYRNEAECASAILSSKIPRSEIFFTTKVPPRDISYEGAKKTVRESLEKCEGLGYLDLVLLHAPYGGKTSRLGAWDALVESVNSGHVRSIGVSNYGVHHLDELEAHMKSQNSKIPLSVNQVELHPWLARPDIVKWCEERGVLCQAYSPLVRAQRFDEPKLRSVCERTGKGEAQVLVRWSLQMGFVPLPKSVTPERIVGNADVYDFELSEEDMKALETGEYAPCGWDPTTSKD